MRIACVGGGPAGLYFGILASVLPGVHEVTVYERFPAGHTYGWGVVLPYGLLQDLDERDGPTARAIREAAFRWGPQIVDVDGREPVTVETHGYSLRRSELLRILRKRAVELGVTVRFESEVRRVDDLADVDLVVVSDGVGSVLRGAHEQALGTAVRRGRNKYMWLGTSRVFDSFTFPFVRTEAGWVWAHAYGFDSGTSTFIVETGAETWSGLGFDQLTPEETLRRLESLFEAQLEGHELRLPPGTEGRTPWLEFQTITNERWHEGRLVLVGDAAHTAHFTIGSGTRLAMEDAMALADALSGHDSLDTAISAYETLRIPGVRKAQREAANSAFWFENLPRYIDQDGKRFVQLLLARRSSALRRLPPRAYLLLAAAAGSMPGPARWLRRVVERARSRP